MTVRLLCKDLWTARFVCAVLLATGAGQWSDRAAAADPQVRFDVGRMIACRDVTPPDFAASNPNEKIIEAAFRVSILFQRGEPQDLEGLVVTFVSPARRLRVVDFEPKNQQTSDIAGEIEIVETKEVETTKAASIGGDVAGELGLVKIKATPTLGATRVHRGLSRETFRRLPKPQLVLTSGTINAEYGVFFKMRPSAQVPLEGMKQFKCRLAVPRSWRGDWALVSCVARGQRRSLFSRKVAVFGRIEVPVALYLEGDLRAKRRAMKLARGKTVASTAHATTLPASFKTLFSD